MKIIINEHQEKLLHKFFLNEAAKEEFSTETLDSLPTFAARLKYCKEMLGFPIGSGSSRVVFQIDDEKVLKLAKNAKGIAQNEHEYDYYSYDLEDTMAQVFETSKNSSWIISEYVLPAKEKDFKHLLGLSFDEFKYWIYRTIYNYADGRTRYYIKYYNSLQMSEERWLDILENVDAIKPIEYYLSNYQPDNFHDFLRIANWGLVNRQDGPHLVILDNGINQEIFNTYYKRW